MTLTDASIESQQPRRPQHRIPCNQCRALRILRGRSGNPLSRYRQRNESGDSVGILLTRLRIPH